MRCMAARSSPLHSDPIQRYPTRISIEMLADKTYILVKCSLMGKPEDDWLILGMICLPSHVAAYYGGCRSHTENNAQREHNYFVGACGCVTVERWVSVWLAIINYPYCRVCVWIQDEAWGKEDDAVWSAGCNLSVITLQTTHWLSRCNHHATNKDSGKGSSTEHVPDRQTPN